MSDLNLVDYNRLVVNSAVYYTELHKIKTKVYRHLKTDKFYFTIGTDMIIECTNNQPEEHKVLYSDGIRLYCREAEEFYKKFESVNV